LVETVKVLNDLGARLEMRLERRQILRAGLVGAGLLALPGCGGKAPAAPASPGKPISFRFGFQPSSSAVLPLIAQSEGYFGKENITYQPFPSSAQTGTQVAAVTGGSLDGYETSITTLVQTLQKGVKVRMLGGLIASPRGLAVPVKDTSSPAASGNTIAGLSATLKALNSKTIGVPGITGAPAHELQALTKQAGATPSLHFVDVATGSATLAALKTATVDAVYSNLLSVEQAVVAGYARQLMTSNNGPVAYGRSLLVGEMVAQTFLDQYPDFAERHQRAIVEAAKVFNDKSKRSRVIQILASFGITFSGVDPSKYLDETPVYPTIPKATVTAALDFTFEAHVLEGTKPAPTDILVPQALS
jgi:ABC-type nitrate/sulfonate/bicarbonate transport system substrate-binding protein